METNLGIDQKNKSFFKKFATVHGFIAEVMVQDLLLKTEDELQYLILKRGLIQEGVSKMLEIKDKYVKEKEWWRRFYQKYFSRNFNIVDVEVPECPQNGQWFLMFIPKHLTHNVMYSTMKKFFSSTPQKLKVYRFNDNLDKIYTISSFETKIIYSGNVYPVWVRKDPVSEHKFRGKAAKKSDPYMNIGITLLECMIMHMAYYELFSKHINWELGTLCSGSRYSEIKNYLPGIIIRDGELRIDIFNEDYEIADYGIREAVHDTV